MPRKKHARRGNLPAARNGTVGKPSMLTPRTADAICHAVLQGNHLTTAAASAGISRSTMYRWIEQADAVETAIRENKPYDEDALPYLEFRDRLADARAQAEMRAVKVVMKAMSGGHLIRETPLQTAEGNLVTLPGGEVAYDRVYAQPDGRLALSYLGRSRPGEWGASSQNRVELTGAGGGPVKVEHTADQIETLAARLHAVAVSRRADAEDDDWDDEDDGGGDGESGAEGGGDVHDAVLVHDETQGGEDGVR